MTAATTTSTAGASRSARWLKSRLRGPGRAEFGVVALVVISHDLTVVHKLCDEVLVDPRTAYTRELIAAVPRLPERC